jgi:hypothetical protein
MPNEISALGEDTFKRIGGDCKEHKLDPIAFKYRTIWF